METLPNPKPDRLTPLPEPVWAVRARRNLGVRETPGRVSTPSILKYRVMAKTFLGGDDGDVPWCAIFVGAMLEASNVRGSRSAMARSYARWGQDCTFGRFPLGAVVVLNSSRGPASGHVGFAVAVSDTHVWLLGGNQGDTVSIAAFQRRRVVAVRWPDGQIIPASMSVNKVTSAAREVSEA